ncbi:hypothetical protein K456DRAFT_1136995 [Colletotrichum gloeosporioides 23]|nr:hypothetical protein K456DRAFT_1136995 [Colletotrichum gloeosporioides 23]
MVNLLNRSNQNVMVSYLRILSAYLHCEYLLSLRLITLASEDLIYYSLRPTTQTTTPVYCYYVSIPSFC